jgi:hypothetical protein
MSERSPYQDLREAGTQACRGGIRGRFFLGCALLLIGAGETLAADQSSIAADPARLGESDSRLLPSFSASSFPAASFALPGAYSMPPNIPEPKSFSAKDFRPRGHSILDLDPHLSVTDDALISDTPAWQRLSEYRTLDRVQVLTLWRSHASTVSLQTGRHGSPSLQWTSRLMNHGGATRGLLDRLFPVSATSESSASRVAPHPAASQSTAKVTPSLSAPHLGTIGSP